MYANRLFPLKPVSTVASWCQEKNESFCLRCDGKVMPQKAGKEMVRYLRLGRCIVFREGAACKGFFVGFAGRLPRSCSVSGFSVTGCVSHTNLSEEFGSISLL